MVLAISATAKIYNAINFDVDASEIGCHLFILLEATFRVVVHYIVLSA